MSTICTPNLDSVTTIRDDGSRRFIHPADVRGRFTSARRWAGWFLIVIYITLPWIQIDGTPAIFFDLAHRQVHLFGVHFEPQDFWLGVFGVTGAGFFLFYFTALWGRFWCGWMCPQTVFLDHVVARIERLFEGNSGNRRKLDRAPWTLNKMLRRGGKWIAFAVLSFVIALVFLSYYNPLRTLLPDAIHQPQKHFLFFGVLFFVTGAMAFNFAWFREQFCIILCPYGRLQSVLIDDHSIVIGYDKGRGEPRGKLGRQGAGDCVDCLRCVQVCPTGIDIRQGLQMECISCAKCVDACDGVMRKIKRAPGLIRYDSMTALKGGKTRWIRPRTILYAALLVIGMIVSGISVMGFKTVDVSARRMVGAPYYRSERMLRNQYLVRISNKSTGTARFRVEIVADEQPHLSSSGFEQEIDVDPLTETVRPLIILIPESDFKKQFPVRIRVWTTGKKLVAEQKVPFIGPHSL